MTGDNFQFAARRLRVFERGVFHLGFAMFAFHLRATASAARVFAISARRAQAATVFAAHQPERERGRDELAYQIAQIQLGAAQDVVIPERIARPARRVETLVNADVYRDGHRVETSIALAGGIHVNRSVDLQASFHAPQIKRNLRGSWKRDEAERRNNDRIVERDRPSCVQQRTDVDDQRRTRTIERGPPARRDPMQTRPL